MNLLIINKEIFHNRPPVISSLLALSDLGYNLTLLTVGINDYWRNELALRNVKIVVIPEDKRKTLISKIYEYINFRFKVFSYLRRNLNDKKGSLLWIIGGNTIWCLGAKIKNYRYVLQIQELHEKDKKYLSLFRKIINGAECVFMNEYNRAILYQCFFNMKKRPIVIPNKPYFIPSGDMLLQLKQKYSSYTELFGRHKVLLYQGHIGRGRDLSPFVYAVKELGEDFRLVCMGQDHGDMKKYREIDSKIIHIPYIPAPDYLLFTSLAYIGIVSYDPTELNNCYCAPNKIWEYSSYSLPMICNDIPGLKYTVGYSKAGVIADIEDKDSIICAIKEIDSNYDLYKENSYNMNASVDNKEIIRKALKI